MEVFRERLVEETQLLPSVRRVEKLYSAIEALSEGASNLHIKPESTHESWVRADLACEISKNISKLGLEASEPLSSRFARMLNEF